MIGSFITGTKTIQETTKVIIEAQCGNTILTNLKSLSKMVTDFESITKLGREIQFAGKVNIVTPEDIKTAIGETRFNELSSIAQHGREFLDDVGFKPENPTAKRVIMGNGGVKTEHEAGSDIAVEPYTIGAPGASPLEGAIFTPMGVFTKEPPTEKA